MGGKGSGLPKGSKRREWSAWDDHIIKVNLDLGPEAIAEWLECGVSSVRGRAFKLGLRFTPKPRSLTNVRPRPMCKVCNLRSGASQGKDGKGRQRFRNLCGPCYSKRGLHKKDLCEKCGFIPQHSSQLDVDHIDGNKANNDINNLMTLCANCHRLKTYQHNDWNGFKNGR